MSREDLISLSEQTISQLPALHLLQNLGYNYLTPQEALQMRAGRLRNILLEEVLVGWLREHNRIHYKGREYPFSEGNIFSAIEALRVDIPEGLVRTNEKIYDLLTLGKSMQQSIVGDLRSFTLNYIDWLNPERRRNPVPVLLFTNLVRSVRKRRQVCDHCH